MELKYKSDWTDDKIAVKCKVVRVAESNIDGSLVFTVKIGNLDDEYDMTEQRFRTTVKSQDQISKDFTPVTDPLSAINKVLGIQAPTKDQVDDTAKS